MNFSGSLNSSSLASSIYIAIIYFLTFNPHQYTSLPCALYAGTEKLRVINHMGNVRDVLPMELLGKRNAFSARNTGMLAHSVMMFANFSVAQLVLYLLVLNRRI